jgi:hypothetical protein
MGGKMKNRARLLSVVAFALTLAGCATGPKYTEVKNSIPSLAQDKGRIYFYRSGTMFGSGIQPSVNLNGAVVGESKPGGFFYVDVPPANYEVVLSTEVDKKLTFALDKREQKCVRMSVGLGVLVYRVYPELAEPAICDAEIQDMSYTGSPFKR